MVIQAGVVSEHANDSQHFLLEHFDVICESPSHIYHSALPLSPSSSWLRKCYSAELSPMVGVVKGLPTEWGMCSHSVFLNSYTEALSYHNNTIAAGSVPGDILILNSITGSQTSVLSGHTEMVTCLTFSSDGTSLVSGSGDRTVKLWDLQTGGVVKTFSGHTDWVWSVSISADFTKIASGSNDDTIHLWDIQTGECHCTIEQQNLVECVIFSPIDPQHLISVCDEKIWHWNTNGHKIKPPQNGTYIAFSPDGTQIVSCNGTAVTIQDSNSGITVTELHMANNKTGHCCFSPDGKLVAAAANNTVYVWDITGSDPHPAETFISHTKRITSLAFSSYLISASEDQSIKFWNISTLSKDMVVTGPKSTPFISVPIQSVTLQAKDGIIITSDSDGMVKIWDISTGLCKTSFQTPAKDSPKRDAQLINGKLIFIWHSDFKINIWGTEKGELPLAVYGPGDYVDDLRISGDGSRVFSLYSQFIQALSVQTGEDMGRVELGFSTYVRSFTVDSSRVWVYCPHSGYQGWDFGIPGSVPVQLPGVPPHRLHPNGTMLWDISLSRLKDTATGKVVFRLSRGFATPIDAQWNGQYLVVCYPPKEVLILDFSHFLL